MSEQTQTDATKTIQYKSNGVQVLFISKKQTRSIIQGSHSFG